MDILAQLLPGTTTFESTQVNAALGAGGLSAFLLGLGFWIKRYLPPTQLKWIPGILLVVGMVTYIIMTGFNFSTIILAFLASNAAVGLYEGGKSAKAGVKAVKAIKAAKK